MSGTDDAGTMDLPNGPDGPPDGMDGLVARTEGLQPWRRVFHAASGVALALGPGLLGLEHPALLLVLTALLVVALALDLARLRLRKVNLLFFRVFASLASPREAGRLASSTWYLVGALVVWGFFPSRAVPALLVLGLADPAAGVVGRLWGRRRLGKGSVLGGATFLAVTLAVLLPAVGGWAAVGAALVVTAVELLPLPLDDNLSVPTIAAVALRVMAP